MLTNKSIKYTLIGAISLALLVSLLTAISVRSQQGQSTKTENQPTRKQLEDAAAPVVDFAGAEAAAEDKSSRRSLKNARHNKAGFVIAQPSSTTGDIRMYDDPMIPIVDFPVDQSDVVVEGHVVSSEAFLSEDKTGVYSEFTIRVSKVLKARSDLPVTDNDMIAAERLGGRVRYPSGKIVRYRVAGEGSPVKGQRYLFFLKETAPDIYQILTAYELRGNKVFSLDGATLANRGSGPSIFEKHNGKELIVFMDEVTKALQSSNPHKNKAEGQNNE
jgi:hypothetical protein